MGLDISAVKVNHLQYGEWRAMLGVQVQNFSLEKVEEIEKQAMELKEELKNEEYLLRFKKEDGKYKEFKINKYKWVKLIFDVWKDKFDKRGKYDWYYAMYNYRNEDTERFIYEILNRAVGKETKECFYNCEVGMMWSGKLEWTKFEGYEGLKYHPLWLDAVGHGEFVSEENEEFCIERWDNHLWLEFENETFEEHKDKFTPMDQGIYEFTLGYSFYNSNDRWMMPLFLIIGKYEMYKKYKPEFLEKECANEKTLGENVEEVIERRLTLVAG